MFLFLFLLLPFSLTLFLIKNGTRYSTSIFIGIVSAVLICSFNLFFVTSSHVIHFSFKTNFINCLFKQLLLPVILLYGLFFIISRDTLEYKTKSFFPLICSFYSIYMPFFILKGHSVNYSFYELFCEALLFLTMIATVSVYIKNLFNPSIKRIGLKILYIFLILIYLITPAIIQTLYIVSPENIFLYVLFVIYTIIPFSAFIFRKFFDFQLSFFPID